MSNTPSHNDADIVRVSAADLPVYCPGPKAQLWSQHPRIYIEVVKSGMGQCQYCGTRYALKEGEKPHGHH